uniref:Uncharacterized protein n=1 Tax=Amphimedon queenslandica TaxID=400682 RepID=A0A1X7UE58_AMPQE
MRENKRCYLPVLTTPTSGNTSLETIFPFDPYHLKRSSKYLNGLYREWNEDNEFTEEERLRTVYRIFN